MSKEFKYYVPLIMGFILCIIGVFCPPMGEISTGVLYGSGMFLCLCAAVVGLDVPAILAQVNEMKRLSLEQFKIELNARQEENQ